MAGGRKEKNTVDFFSHDADASSSKTLTILEARFGAEGYATWFKLLELLSASRNHIYVYRNAEDFEYLSAKLKLIPEKLEEILRKMAELEAIDPELLKHRVIWCQNLVDRLKPIYHRRAFPLPCRPQIVDGNLISVNSNSISDSRVGTEMPLSYAEIPQSKGKESKVNNTLKSIRKNVNKNSINVNKNESRQAYGEFKNVLLTDEQRSKLTERFGSQEAQERIENISAAIAAKGYSYKDFYAAILSWDRKDKRDQNNGHKGNSNGSYPKVSTRTLPDRDEYEDPAAIRAAARAARAKLIESEQQRSEGSQGLGMGSL